MKVLNNLRFRTQIILVCVLVLLLNSIICGSLYYNYAYKDTLENFYSSTEDMVSQMRMQLTSETKAITEKIHAVFNNLSFYTPMSQFLIDKESKNIAVLLGDISDMITEFQTGMRFIHSVNIETESQSFDNFTRIRNHDFRFMESEMCDVFKEDLMKTIQWYPTMTSPVFKGKEHVIPVVYRFRIARKDVFVMVSLSCAEIKDFLEETYDSYDAIFIADSNNENILNCNNENIQILNHFAEEDLGRKNAVCKEVEMDGDKYLATYTIMEDTGWKICALRSTSSLVGNLEELRHFIIILICFCTLISICLIIMIVRRITRPLGQLASIMNQVSSEENFQKRFEYSYKNEIGHLSTSFNYMISKINKLILELNVHIEALKQEKETVRLIQMQKRKAELKALQAQINPHFLYNTLNAISWQAMDQGATEISVLSNSLGKFFRVSLSKGKEVITVREELEHVESYLKIQSIRYKNKIQYEFCVHEDVKELYIIKLVLQPLVENAIYHGIKTKAGVGFIRIAIDRGVNKNGIHTLLLSVEDNGQGISAERLQIIKRGLTDGYIEEDSGYGIYNVNERIKLYYGESYGLDIDSVQHQWTKAAIVMPVQTTEKEM